MRPRRLNIMIIVLYAVAAFCMLGMGSVREQLQEERAAQTSVTTQKESAGKEQEGRESVSSPRIKELQNKLTIWQVAALVIFTTASLLLILREKLIKKIPPPAK